MFKATAGTTPFSVNVMTSSNGGHSPEAVAELCVDRIVRIADSAPPELAMQARAFRQQVLEVVLQHVRMAVTEDRATVSAKLEQAGLTDLAQQIRRL
jgi:predicted Na+-dependent transporter